MISLEADRVVSTLVEAAERDPLPAQHTSSFWLAHGVESVVERHGRTITLRPGGGFEQVGRLSLPRRVLSALERASYRRATAQIKHFASAWKAARRLACDLTGGSNMNFNVFKSACALGLLMDHWRAEQLSPRAFTMIGDGYGFLGALIRRYLPGIQLYCIDLPKMLVFQVWTHRRADPAAACAELSGDDWDRSAQVIFVSPSQIERIPGPIDCAVNIASMQEMTPASIAGYFAFLRQRSAEQSRFYCVNRQHKRLPDGLEIEFARYPWHPDDEVFVDGPCPYYTHFVGASTLRQGPRVGGVRVPFVNAFDGPHWHRLVRLAPRVGKPEVQGGSIARQASCLDHDAHRDGGLG